ncbi:helix-turn-helix domain-containing protein, partial [Salmonella enterica subsp. enterica serovar Reading]|nr:helix-turn-helix domain-containing protein [Salmonella enterica subsp. enterica serovar Reading]
MCVSYSLSSGRVSANHEERDVRFPNQRLAQLFAMLQNETLPQDELAQRLSVSTRTVRADIAALNMLLTP